MSTTPPAQAAPLRTTLAVLRGRPWLILVAGVLQGGIALLAAWPLSSTLAPLLDRRPASIAMLGGDDGLIVELLQDHPELLRAAATPLVLAVLVHALASLLLAGGLLVVLGESGAARADPARLAAATAQQAGRMVRVSLWVLPLRLLPAGLAAAAWALARWIGGDDLLALAVRAALAATLLCTTWALTSVVRDYARAMVIADPVGSALRAVTAAARLAARRPGATARIAAWSSGSWLAATGLATLLIGLLPIAWWTNELAAVVRTGAVLVRATASLTALGAAALLTGARPRSE